MKYELAPMAVNKGPMKTPQTCAAARFFAKKSAPGIALALASVVALLVSHAGVVLAGGSFSTLLSPVPLGIGLALGRCC